MTSALLLIASLLACPFRCAGVVSAEVAPASCCASCVNIPATSDHALESEQHAPEPQAPGGQCECISCLCQGAVLPGDDDEVRDTLVAQPWAIDLLPQAHWAQVGDGPTGLELRPPRGDCAAGRPLRLLIQSLQI